MTQKGEPMTNPAPQGIRAWYKQSTRRAMRGLVWATIILVTAIVLVWLFAPLAKLQHAQTFNGALTIPGFGGLWIASFILTWLIPMREVSFRGQESMERMETQVIDRMEEKLVPAIDTWQRIGTKVEEELIPRFEKFLAGAEKAAEQLSSSAKNIEDKASGTLETIDKLESSRIIDEVREATQAMKSFVAPQGAPPSDDAVMRSFGMGSPGNGTPAGVKK